MRQPFLAASLVCLLGAGAHGQENVPSSRTDVVRIDVVVTDGSGRTVRDLTAADFEVLEDGKRQALTHFVFVGPKARPADVAPAAAGAPQEATVATETPASPAEPAPAGRTVLLVVDDLHVAFGGLEHTRAALRRILDDFIAADDQVALVTTSGTASMTTFTRERGPLMQAITRLRVRDAAVGDARNSQMTPGHAELILGGDRGALELAGRSLIADPGNIYENSGPRAAAEGQSALGNSAAGMEDRKLGVAEQDARRQARGILLEALTFSTMTLRGVENALRSMAEMPGRKICLLVSDGFLVGMGTSEERTHELQSVVDAATRAGAAVYSLDSRGLVPTGGDASTAGQAVPAGLQFRIKRQVDQMARNTLASVAEQTGGFLVKGTNDLEAGLRRMLEDSGAYYLLVYEPANTKRDGKFRKLEVRLPNHRGYEIRTRRGYFAPDDRKKAPGPVPAAPSPALTTAADLHALLEQPPTAGVPVRLAVDYVDLPPAGSQAIVHARLDLGGLPWQKVKDRHQLGLDVVVGAFDAASGARVGEPSARRTDIQLTDAELKRARQEGFFHRVTLPLPPGRYEVRLLARALDGTALGGGREGVVIPDVAAGQLTLSSVFLSSSGGASETVRDVQSARRLKRGDTLVFQLYVYNPRRDQDQTDVVLQAQLRSGEKVIAASRPQPVVFQEKDGAPTPQTHSMGLEGLPAGAYDLRVVVVDRKASVTASRDVSFTLE